MVSCILNDVQAMVDLKLVVGYKISFRISKSREVEERISTAIVSEGWQHMDDTGRSFGEVKRQKAKTLNRRAKENKSSGDFI